MTAAILAVAAVVHVMASYVCRKAGHPEFSTTLLGLSIAFGVFALISLI